MIEEIPTLEHVKLRRPDLYHNWNCLMCNQYSETFNHVWCCSQHRHILHGIIYRHQKRLVSIVKDFNQGIKQLTHTDLAHPTLWTISYSATQFTFINLVKGIIPSFLFDIVNNVIIDPIITQNILSLFSHHLYVDIMEKIWKPRCEVVLRMEQFYNINKRTKKKPKPVGVRSLSSHNNRHRIDASNSSFSSDQYGVIHYIRTG